MTMPNKTIEKLHLLLWGDIWNIMIPEVIHPMLNSIESQASSARVSVRDQIHRPLIEYIGFRVGPIGIPGRGQPGGQVDEDLL